MGRRGSRFVLKEADLKRVSPASLVPSELKGLRLVLDGGQTGERGSPVDQGGTWRATDVELGRQRGHRLAWSQG